MFLEGVGKPKTVGKNGAAAKLTNGLVVYAKEAVDALWKARGYHKMKPKQREEKLGYQLDREEALGYLITSALHMPLLLPEEARMIGKRAGSLSVFTKLAEFKKKGTTASPPCVSLLAEAAPLSFSFKRPRASPTPPTPLLASPPPPSLPLPPPSLPMPEADDRVKYLHPDGCRVDGKWVWSDNSIPGYRGCPGMECCSDGGGCFWNPEKPPCIPSDHRPDHLFRSPKAAEAAELAERLEFLSKGWQDDEGGQFFDEEEIEIKSVRHKYALRRLHASFPEVADQEHHSRPCPCGRGALAMWPWVVQTAQLGFCECDMALWERQLWRSEWVKAAGCSKGLADMVAQIIRDRR
jgi:hypothetical protein